MIPKQLKLEKYPSLEPKPKMKTGDWLGIIFGLAMGILFCGTTYQERVKSAAQKKMLIRKLNYCQQNSMIIQDRSAFERGGLFVETHL